MLCIATIVSANYLAYAKTLADSVRLWEPDAEFRVLIVDRAVPKVKEAVQKLGLTAVYAEELGLDDFEQLTFKYDIVELNTALKPTFLKRLLAQGFEQVWYMDPDIRLYRTVVPVKKALEHASIALTPHAVAPAMDGFRPSDIDFLRTGSYNLGFIAFRKTPEAARMLDWWESRCLAYGFNDLGFGTFVDQKWIDLVPAYFDGVSIVKHPGCNVAYWNLHERKLTEEGGRIEVNGEELCFFHFSGVKAERPDLLSKHQTRHEIRPGSILSRLVREYCGCLIANEHAVLSKIEYTFGTFDDGVQINKNVRRSVTFVTGGTISPFSSHGHVRKLLARHGVGFNGKQSSGKETTLNFSQTAPKVIWINRLMRILVRVIGIDRAAELLRYGTLLSREANLLRVIMKQPFDFSHGPNYSRHLK